VNRLLKARAKNNVPGIWDTGAIPAASTCYFISRVIVMFCVY
jgi:hypothetical protein